MTKSLMLICFLSIPVVFFTASGCGTDSNSETYSQSSTTKSRVKSVVRKTASTEKSNILTKKQPANIILRTKTTPKTNIPRWHPASIDGVGVITLLSIPSRKKKPKIKLPVPKPSKENWIKWKWAINLDTAKFGDVTAEWNRIRKAANTPAQLVRRRELYAVIMVRYSRATKKHFLITGEIVDEQGTPLDEVRFYLTKSINIAGRGEPREERVNLKLSSRFAIATKGGNYLHMNFWKKGYYGTPSITLDDLDEEFEGRLALQVYSRDKFPRRIIKKHFRIVLEKKGKQTRLHTYYEDLNLFPNGSGQVIDFDKPSSYRTINALRSLNDTRDKKSWPKHGIILTAKTVGIGKDAKFATFKQNILAPTAADGGPGPFSPPGTIVGRRTHPVGVKLIFTDLDGGLQYMPEPKTLTADEEFLLAKNGKWKSQRIKEAPKDGYTLRELILKPRYPQKYQRFYIKVRGKYGWGKIHRVALDGKELECQIEIHLQPDGSRNLEQLD